MNYDVYSFETNNKHKQRRGPSGDFVLNNLPDNSTFGDLKLKIQEQTKIDATLQQCKLKNNN